MQQIFLAIEFPFLFSVEKFLSIEMFEILVANLLKKRVTDI